MRYHRINKSTDFPNWIDRDSLAGFLHDNLIPYEDPIPDIQRGLDYAFSDEPGKGGFVMLAEENEELLGALVMLHTGMEGYIPPNLLLFVAVRSDTRGRGIGGGIIDQAISECEGDVCLHVEYDNPAKRLYERVGFKSKYAEMRYER